MCDARAASSLTFSPLSPLSLILNIKPPQIWDRIVVGAGVAGSALAYKQAKVRRRRRTRVAAAGGGRHVEERDKGWGGLLDGRDLLNASGTRSRP